MITVFPSAVWGLLHIRRTIVRNRVCRETLWACLPTSEPLEWLLMNMYWRTNRFRCGGRERCGLSVTHTLHLPSSFFGKAVPRRTGIGHILGKGLLRLRPLRLKRQNVFGELSMVVCNYSNSLLRSEANRRKSDQKRTNLCVKWVVWSRTDETEKIYGLRVKLCWTLYAGNELCRLSLWLPVRFSPFMDEHPSQKEKPETSEASCGSSEASSGNASGSLISSGTSLKNRLFMLHKY